jgi:hypothetical protein
MDTGVIVQLLTILATLLRWAVIAILCPVIVVAVILIALALGRGDRVSRTAIVSASVILFSALLAGQLPRKVP